MSNATTSTSHFHADLMIDSSLDTAGTIAARWMDIKLSTSSAHCQFNGSYVTYLAADQYVKMKLTASPATIGSGNATHNYFSGFLLG